MTTDLSLRWQPSSHTRQLVTVVAVALLVALASSRVELLALATPLLWTLAAGSRASLPSEVHIDVALDPERCFEGEPVVVTVTVSVSSTVDEMSARLEPNPALTAVAAPEDVLARAQGRTDRLAWVIEMTAGCWGRHNIGDLDIGLSGMNRLATAVVPVPTALVLAVFPRPATLVRAGAATTLPDRSGDHVAAAVGSGVEFASVRQFAFGDSIRRVNWRVSSRRGQLHVNEYAAERAADVILVVDALSDVGPPGRSSLDITVRGAVGVVRRYLQGRDRVGLVVIGGALRWLTPAVGELQLYRVVESVLMVRRDFSFVEPDLGRVPRAALPPGALLVVFSPLLDDRSVETIRDLRERGFELTVVDVLTVEPSPDPSDRLAGLAIRLWRLDRAALRLRLGELGVPVVPWNGNVPLDGPLQAARRRPRGTARAWR